MCLLSRRSATSRLEVATTLCTSSCADGCFAIPYAHQIVTDEHCAPCATGQSWWPCNIENLCSCGREAKWREEGREAVAKSNPWSLLGNYNKSSDAAQRYSSALQLLNRTTQTTRA